MQLILIFLICTFNKMKEKVKGTLQDTTDLTSDFCNRNAPK
jgi:hypothetical protein